MFVFLDDTLNRRRLGPNRPTRCNGHNGRLGSPNACGWRITAAVAQQTLVEGPVPRACSWKPNKKRGARKDSSEQSSRSSRQPGPSASNLGAVEKAGMGAARDVLEGGGLKGGGGGGGRDLLERGGGRGGRGVWLGPPLLRGSPYGPRRRRAQHL